MDLLEIESSDYSVYIGGQGFTMLQQMLTSKDYADVRKVILVDENTHTHCLTALLANVEALHEAEVMEVESGEENKNLEICYGLWRTLSDLHADRKSVLINLGGGVIGDMGGFVASTYKRGIRFIQLPTTLLAQVDASVGGKVGVDLDGLKNQIGVFNNPEAVILIPDFLRTLGKDQMISGFAEVIKHGLIRDAAYWEQIKATDLSRMEDIEALLARSVEIKNEVVLEDPQEQGLRKILNFGHTIGHAIETHSLEGEGRSLLHGDAIAIGMICECFLSHRKGWLSEVELNEVRDFIMSVYKPYEMDDVAYHRLIELMRNDKKNEGDTINFTLLRKIGEAAVNQTFHSDDIIAALDYYRGLVNAKAT